jgi:hypothetical protein
MKSHEESKATRVVYRSKRYLVRVIKTQDCGENFDCPFPITSGYEVSDLNYLGNSTYWDEDEADAIAAAFRRLRSQRVGVPAIDSFICESLSSGTFEADYIQDHVEESVGNVDSY